MFNEKAADPKKSKPDEIINNLNLKAGQKVLDFGSGGGYFALRFAEIIGSTGEIVCLDKNEELLNHIKQAAEKKGFHQLKYVDSIEKVPDNYVDLIFIRNVYHHLEDRIELLKELKTKLKYSARVAIIEYKKSGSLLSFHRVCGHNVDPQIIKNEAKEANLKVIQEFSFLPEQSFTIFS